MLPTLIDRKDMIDFGYRADTAVAPDLHSHTSHEVYYFHEGSCTYLIGDKVYALEPGDLLLMNGMTLHCAKIDPSVPYVRSIVHFEPAVLKPFLELPRALDVMKPFRELRNHRIRLSPAARAEVERLLAFMDAQKRRGDRIGDSRMLLAFIDLLHIVYDECRQPMDVRGGAAPSEKEKTAQAIVAYLEANYADDLHLDDLQKHLHLSKYYLAKLFKEVTGVTVFDYIYQYRINQARILFLLDPRISVTEVCFRSGFKHLAHFSRQFKRIVGVPPERFRRQVRDEPGPFRPTEGMD